MLKIHHKVQGTQDDIDLKKFGQEMEAILRRVETDLGAKDREVRVRRQGRFRLESVRRRGLVHGRRDLHGPQGRDLRIPRGERGREDDDDAGGPRLPSS